MRLLSSLVLYENWLATNENLCGDLRPIAIVGKEKNFAVSLWQPPFCDYEEAVKWGNYFETPGTAIGSWDLPAVLQKELLCRELDPIVQTVGAVGGDAFCLRDEYWLKSIENEYVGKVFTFSDGVEATVEKNDAYRTRYFLKDELLSKIRTVG